MLWLLPICAAVAFAALSLWIVARSSATDSVLKSVLHTAMIALLFAAMFFFTAGNLTHMSCCSQRWVEEAKTAAERQDRAETRIRRIGEVSGMMEKTYGYCVLCLIGSATCVFACYGLDRRGKSRASREV